MPASLDARRIEKTGAARIARIASPAMAAGQGRACTTIAQRAQKPGRDGVSAAIRRRSPFRAFYDQLTARGRPKKGALVAVMRKLLTILNAILRDHTPWRHANA